MDMDKTICFCHDVSVQDIVDAIDAGADSLEAVQEATGAGTGCGGCMDELTEIVDQLLNESK